MSQATTFNLQPLDKKLRNKLERTVKEARDVAEEAARSACKQLGVGRAKADEHLTDEEKDLRRRLRIHGRQLGDKRDTKKETQQLDRLIDEIAYEHWHRMLFARFLAENHLLMYPDPDAPVSVSIDDCNDLAADEGAKNGWELAARFAARMLPQIFRLESPVFSLTLPPENQQQLERLLSDLPDEVFTASDSLGWVYQFWQAKRKDEVNASEVKIGARELPAVTQLFTEPYMVSFLLDNSLGAWWAARRLSEEDLRTAKSEQELRDKAALPGVPLEYLRFVREPTALAAGSDDPGSNADTPEASAYGSGPWTPAAGTFDAWPESLAELKTLDPCCGSGHFLVAALLMLAPMRMELEGLSAQEAVDRVLSENLHGLEIDQRCVELAAFALALTAWRFPGAGGYRSLPDLNVACCGLSVSVAKEEWKELAKDNKQLRIALDWMYDEFKDAPVLGSLLNPAKSMAAKVTKWEELGPIIEAALNDESDETREVAVVAHGLAKAAILMARKFSWVFTNVPYLARGKQIDKLRKTAESVCESGKNDLATVFLRRCLDLCVVGGACTVVLPQNWLFLSGYRRFRELLLERETLNMIVRLGAGAFETISGEVVNAILAMVSHGNNESITLGESSESLQLFSGIDVSEIEGVAGKNESLRTDSVSRVTQNGQLRNPDARISLVELGVGELLGDYCSSIEGLTTGDMERFVGRFWDRGFELLGWEPYIQNVDDTSAFGGRSDSILWESGDGTLTRFPSAHNFPSQIMNGRHILGKQGLRVTQMGDMPVTFYGGEVFGKNAATVVPHKIDDLAAVWCFCSSRKYGELVRQIDQSLKVTNGTLIKVPFDFRHWQQVAAEKYPHGLPQPYSDDPTQWIFHAHPASSTDALHVAVARLLGYRWPAELDKEMELAVDARAWVERSSELTGLADTDGIVCIPAVGTEQPAEDRLLNLLHKAYEDGRAVENLFQEKLDAGDLADPLTLALSQSRLFRFERWGKKSGLPVIWQIRQ